MSVSFTYLFLSPLRSLKALCVAGAELFAKRKKRMDKFIVDETTVQKAQQQTTSVQQTSSFSSSFSSSSKSVSSSSSFSSMKQAEMERNRQQEQIMVSSGVSLHDRRRHS